MSAAVLREAAALMRSQVEKAAEQTETQTDVKGVWLNSRFYMVWHPAVALATADWLDSTARFLGRGELARARDLHAIRVARAYLGDQS